MRLTHAARRLDHREPGRLQLLEPVRADESVSKPALEALPQIKRDRKIFFLMEWLSAFVEGQHSAAAQAEVHQYLRTAALDEGVRLKILQVVDELDRTVTIRRKYPE